MSKYSKSILLIDKLSDVALGASGAAGAFLSPLLGKPNNFKRLVSNALAYSTKFYKENTPSFIDNCGVIRIPKDEFDRKKFTSYKSHMDFEYEIREDGYFFKIGSIINAYNTCKTLTNHIEKYFNYEVHSIKQVNTQWYVNNNLVTQKLILTTGVDTGLIKEKYFEIRPVWGQRIDVETSTSIDINYHKECSLSKTQKLKNGKYLSSIGATHHRGIYDRNISIDDTKELLDKANNIKKLHNLKVLKAFKGARAASVDYFPIVGKIVDSTKTLKEFPYLKNGTSVQSKRFSRYDNLYVMNGVGGRGFVLAPYLAKHLVELIVKQDVCLEEINPDRLFTRWVRKI